MFYGDNYVVTLWFDSTIDMITLQVWSWYGRWVSWQPKTGLELTNTVFDSSTIEVIAASQFFAVTFDSGADSVAYVFSKAPGSPGQFVPAMIDGKTTAPNVPTATFTNAAGITSYFPGSSFFCGFVHEPEHGHLGIRCVHLQLGFAAMDEAEFSDQEHQLSGR